MQVHDQLCGHINWSASISFGHLSEERVGTVKWSLPGRKLDSMPDRPGRPKWIERVYRMSGWRPEWSSTLTSRRALTTFLGGGVGYGICMVLVLHCHCQCCCPEFQQSPNPLVPSSWRSPKKYGWLVGLVTQLTATSYKLAKQTAAFAVTEAKTWRSLVTQLKKTFSWPQRNSAKLSDWVRVGSCWYPLRIFSGSGRNKYFEELLHPTTHLLIGGRAAGLGGKLSLHWGQHHWVKMLLSGSAPGIDKILSYGQDASWTSPWGGFLGMSRQVESLR